MPSTIAAAGSFCTTSGAVPGSVACPGSVVCPGSEKASIKPASAILIKTLHRMVGQVSNLSYHRGFVESGFRRQSVIAHRHAPFLPESDVRQVRPGHGVVERVAAFVGAESSQLDEIQNRLKEIKVSDSEQPYHARGLLGLTRGRAQPARRHRFAGSTLSIAPTYR